MNRRIFRTTLQERKTVAKIYLINFQLKGFTGPFPLSTEQHL